MRYSEGLSDGTRQGFLIRHQDEVTREPIRALVSFTVQRNLCASTILTRAEHEARGGGGALGYLGGRIRSLSKF